MKAFVSPADDLKQSIFLKMDDFDLFIPDNHEDQFALIDFWLGWSRDGQVWALFTNIDEGLGEFEISDDKLISFLVSPPKRNPKTIGAILFAIYRADLLNQGLEEDKVQSIVQSFEFPNYRPVADYLPDAPIGWRHLPAEMVVDFSLSENSCVHMGTFAEFHRDSLEDAMAELYLPRQCGILIRYSLWVREVIPILNYEMDWPLSRRGKELPHKCQPSCGDYPWSQDPNTKLFVVYQHAPGVGLYGSPHAYCEPTIRLAVAGADQNSSVANWHIVSKCLRKIRRQLPDGGK